MTDEVLRLEDVSAGYDDLRALWDINLSVRSGEITVLLGPNGAGKTTLLSTIAGLLRTYSGKILFEGRDVTTLQAHTRARLGLGLVQENKRIFRRRTVEENLMIGGFWRYRRRRDLRAAIEAEYDRFPILRERRDKPAGTLSGGEQQMLAISQVVLAKPRVLMLDEPSAGLAPEIVRRVFSAVAALRDSGMAIILVEQVVHGPLEIADTIGVLDLGRLVLFKAKRDIEDISEIERLYFGEAGATSLRESNQSCSSGTYRRVEARAGAGRDGLVVVRRPTNEPGPGECLIRVEVATINRADLHRIDGSYGGVAITPFQTLGDSSRGADESVAVYVPGMEAAGTVIAVGKSVETSLVGTRVLVHSHSWCGQCDECRAGLDNACPHGRVFGSQTPGVGAWSEQVVVPAKQVHVLPDQLPLEHAVCAEVTYGPVWWGLRHRTAVGPHDLVAVQGGDSTLGLAAVQVIKLVGATPVMIVRDRRSPRARQLADLEGVHVRERAEVTSAAFVAEFGRRPLVVLDLLGAASFHQSLELVASGGTVLAIGAHTGASVDLRIDRLFQRNVAIQGIARAPIAGMVEILDLMAAGRLTPRIAREFSLDDVRSAVEFADSRAQFGKTLLRPQKVV